MTPSGIEPVTFQFVAQYLNPCATVVPQSFNVLCISKMCLCFANNFHGLCAFWGYFVFLLLQFYKSLEADECFMANGLWCLWWLLLVVVSCEHEHYCMSTGHWWNGDVTSYLVCNCRNYCLCNISTLCMFILQIWRFLKVMKNIWATWKCKWSNLDYT
jgi:hypothetical protein